MHFRVSSTSLVTALGSSQFDAAPARPSRVIAPVHPMSIFVNPPQPIMVGLIRLPVRNGATST